MPSSTSLLRPAIVLLGTLVLAACSATRWEEPQRGAAGTTATQSNGQRSSRGNPPFYEVFGERYYVMASGDGYRETGVASWYGKKFHGRPTSSGEIYDMHEMTAAHKTLPLPTRVRVTNLRNGKSVIVNVNDRGPFVDNRLIDMSYAAALELDMITSGTTMVEVEALDGSSSGAASMIATAGDQTPQTVAMTDVTDVRLYLQVGAFGSAVNADQLKRELERNGLSNVVIRYDEAAQPALYRVRLGPIADVSEYDALVTRVAALNIVEPHLVTEHGELAGASVALPPGG